MAEILESIDPVIAWTLEVAFPDSTHVQREAIIYGMSDSTRQAILDLVKTSNIPAIQAIQDMTGRIVISATVRYEVQRLVLESEST